MESAWDDLDIDAHGRAVADLVSQGKVAEADLHLAAHAELAGAGNHRGDAIGWAVMRALLDGRERDARAGVDESAARDPEGPHPEAQERWWAQRLALALTWGDDDECYEVLDHCRERAWCHGDALWQGRLALLLAHLGRGSEARRGFDDAIDAARAGSPGDVAWLDLTTDLVEAAAILGDVDRSDRAGQCLARATTVPVVVVGRAWVCKGSLARYQALAATHAAGPGAGDGYFRLAAETHRRMGADVLLARTLAEWADSLSGYDPSRSAELRRQGAEMALRLGLPARPPSAEVRVPKAS